MHPQFGEDEKHGDVIALSPKEDEMYGADIVYTNHFDL